MRPHTLRNPYVSALRLGSQRTPGNQGKHRDEPTPDSRSITIWPVLAVKEAGPGVVVQDAAGGQHSPHTATLQLTSSNTALLGNFPFSTSTGDLKIYIFHTRSNRPPNNPSFSSCQSKNRLNHLTIPNKHQTGNQPAIHSFRKAGIPSQATDRRQKAPALFAHDASLRNASRTHDAGHDILRTDDHAR